MKDNRLTAQDLMIGDWVKINYRGKFVKVTAIHDGLIDTTAISPLMEDEYEPIPLTPEILEKNWFIRDGESWWYQDFRIVLSTSKGASLVCGRLKNFAFVHELQHALRLCGIEKEITI